MPDVALDKWGGDDRFGNRAVSQLHLFTNSLSLEDFYRIAHPYGRLFTWLNGPHSVGCRLDRFYTPRAWRARVPAHACTTFAYSDHHMISLKLSLGNSNSRGHGLWKFNTQLLKTETFCSAVNEFWPVWCGFKSAFTDPRIWWDAGKLRLKELAISHSVATSRERKRDKVNLENEFRNILSRTNSHSVADQNRLAETKDLLKAIDDRAVEGSIIRSKEQWIELGEKPTKYFYQLENQHQSRNVINALCMGDLSVTSTKDILRECHTFYSSLTFCGTAKLSKSNRIPVTFLWRWVGLSSLTRPKKRELLNCGGFPESAI